MNDSILAGVRNARIPLDVRTKLFYTLVLTTIVMSGGMIGWSFWIRPMMVCIPLILLYFERMNKGATIFLVAYTLSMLTEWVMLHGAGVAMGWQILFTVYSGIIGKLLPGILMGYYTISTTTVSEFIASMQRMHVTEKIIIPMSVMFRFFPTIHEENKSIQQSMKMRGIGIKRGLLTMIEYRMVPLMISIAKIAEELSAASITRGLGAPGKRTNICNVGFHIQDYLLFLLGIGMMTLFLIHR